MLLLSLASTNCKLTTFIREITLKALFPVIIVSVSVIPCHWSRLKTVGDRAFSVAGPREWNRLPGEIRDCQTLGAFKRKLKTHLFRAAYGL